jgi:hypothetical protein
MRPTDLEVAALLLRASWQVQGVGFQLSANEREEMAHRMRELAHDLLPAPAPASYETTPTKTGRGDWTGD